METVKYEGVNITKWSNIKAGDLLDKIGDTEDARYALVHELCEGRIDMDSKGFLRPKEGE